MNIIKTLLKRIHLHRDKRCECGTYEKCPREIKVGDNGDVWVENHFACKQIQDLNEKLNDWWDENHQLKH